MCEPSPISCQYAALSPIPPFRQQLLLVRSSVLYKEVHNLLIITSIGNHTIIEATITIHVPEADSVPTETHFLLLVLLKVLIREIQARRYTMQHTNPTFWNEGGLPPLLIET